VLNEAKFRPKAIRAALVREITVALGHRDHWPTIGV